MAEWRIEFSKNAFKYYEKLDKKMKRRVDKVLFWLSKQEKFKLREIQGEKDIYRIRIGKYRILIKIFYSEKTILIFDLGSRGDIYK